MAGVFNGLFGGSKPSAAPVGDSDFADFAGAADPSPASYSTSASYTSASASTVGLFAAPTSASGVPYTKWYNVHERYSLSDFKQEGVILSILLLIFAIHTYGTRTNRARAKAWFHTHAPALRKEFAVVGFGRSEAPAGEEGQALISTARLLKEETPQKFSTYATGRQNVAFVDATLSLKKRYNPISLGIEYVFSLFFDSFPTPAERFDAILYPFDGKEALTVPGQLPGAHELRKDTKSSYDGFVWAIVNKDNMKQLRDDRYDVSITSTKDSPKLPMWATVMSESAEVTDLLLTPELISAIEEAGEVFEYLIVTDQPVDKPTKLEETVPKKRIYLSTKLPSKSDSITPLFSYFLRLTDSLVESAHFRPEVMRKVRTTREDAIKQLQKVGEDEKAEERAAEREKAKKLKRDLALKGLDAKAQKKFLEKEKEKEMRRSQKKQTMKA